MVKPSPLLATVYAFVSTAALLHWTLKLFSVPSNFRLVGVSVTVKVFSFAIFCGTVTVIWYGTWSPML